MELSDGENLKMNNALLQKRYHNGGNDTFFISSHTVNFIPSIIHSSSLDLITLTSLLSKLLH
jgi:hypothetical protein